MKSLLNMLFSLKFTVILFFLIAFSAAAATFIENDFGTASAKAVVYNALWFEIVIALFAANLAGNIWRFKLWKKEKLPTFIFHASFLVIILGAAITRFAGYEGVMHIREGETTADFLSDNAYVQVSTGDAEFSWPVLFSPLTDNRFEKSFQVDGKPLTVTYENFYLHAAEEMVEDPEGKPFAGLVVAGPEGGREQVDLFPGDDYDAGAHQFLFNKEPERIQPAIRIGFDGEAFTFSAPEPAETMRMDSGEKSTLAADTVHPLEQRTLYTIGGTSFVAKNLIKSGRFKVVPSKFKTNVSGLVMDVAYNGEKATVSLLGGAGISGAPKTVKVGGLEVESAFGSRPLTLPFALRLDDFLLRRYPGSGSPSSYESDVTVIDPEEPGPFAFKIYMNHILEHQGFRFYQSSYDRDELGTVLSVANDPGKTPTYVGYFLMTLGFILALLNPKGRFRKLSASVRKGKTAAALAAAVFLTFAPVSGHAEEAKGIVPPEHAQKFSRLLVQDVQGRIKPMDSLSREVLNKVARSGSMYGLDANQLFLGMVSNPKGWQQIPIVRIGHERLRMELGLEAGSKHAAFHDFFDYKRPDAYKLGQAVEEANRLKPSQRGTYEKELLKADERANILLMAFRGDLLRVFPKRADQDFKWYGPMEAIQTFPQEEAQQVRTLISDYITAVDQGLQGGSWSAADAALEKIAEYQRFYGAAVLPSDSLVRAELLFNKINPFERLAPFYGILGFLLLILAFLQTLNPARSFKKTVWLLLGLLVAVFVGHTAGLGLRWYISGHAPWSNGYESLIYIAWATALSGFVFARHSSFALAATSILAALSLFVAHLSWMDPQITNLVPVLKSYWLTIHVSIISASYGFLALGALLGFITMLLFTLRKESKPNIDQAIGELVRIGEMTLTVGLLMLTVGNMLGAVWANESWGRYWSWDPKETWTLISMMIYAAILHFRFIPPLKSRWTFAFASTVAFSSVIMTYFGVNYYLSGMHSYAAGDPVPVPAFVYWTIAVVAVISVLSWRKRDSLVPLGK